MSSYLIKKDANTGEIIYMQYDLEGYKFRPKNNGEKPYIRVNSVTIYKPEMIEHVLTKKFEKKFNRLSSIILKFLYQDDDDSDEGDFEILLDEIARLKSVVDLQYKKFLSNQEYKDYIHKLTFLDAQVREKLAIINYKNRLNYQFEKGRSM